MKKIIRSVFGLSICVVFSVSICVAQCGADGTQPCSPKPKTKIKSTKPTTKVLPKSKSGKSNAGNIKSTNTSVAKKVVIAPKVPLRRYGGFEGKQKSTEESVDGLFDILKDDQTAKGYIICYGTEESIAEKRNTIISVISTNNYDLSRVTLVEGNDRQSGCEFWIVPEGAENPIP
jgi:hypothetical protein